MDLITQTAAVLRCQEIRYKIGWRRSRSVREGWQLLKWQRKILRKRFAIQTTESEENRRQASKRKENELDTGQVSNRPKNADDNFQRSMKFSDNKAELFKHNSPIQIFCIISLTFAQTKQTLWKSFSFHSQINLNFQLRNRVWHKKQKFCVTEKWNGFELFQNSVSFWIQIFFFWSKMSFAHESQDI